MRVMAAPAKAAFASGAPAVWSSTPQMLTSAKGSRSRTLRFVSTMMPASSRMRSYGVFVGPVIVIAEHGVTAERRRNRRKPAREVARVLGAKTDEVATEEHDVRIDARQLFESVVDGFLRRARTRHGNQTRT
jgi:hypothetical protein